MDSEHIAYLTNVHEDLTRLSVALGSYIKRSLPVSEAIELLERNGQPEEADLAITLVNRLIDQRHLGVMALYVVTFPPNGSSVSELVESFAHEALNQALWKIADGIKGKVPGVALIVTGHCSSSEEDSLAMRRAKGLRDYFAANGVLGDYLRCRAHDLWRPCEVPEVEASFNRRAEIEISYIPPCYSVALAREDLERTLSLIRGATT